MTMMMMRRRRCGVLVMSLNVIIVSRAFNLGPNPTQHQHHQQQQQQQSATLKKSCQLQLGSNDDYLNNLSPSTLSPGANKNNNPADPNDASGNGNADMGIDIDIDEEQDMNTSIKSGFVDIANSAFTKLGKRGARDIKRSTIRAQRVMREGTDNLVQGADNFVTSTSTSTSTTGRGMAMPMSDMHFFQGDNTTTRSTRSTTNSYASDKSVRKNLIVKADEIVEWIDSQAKSGTEMVGRSAEWVDTQAKSGTEMVGSKAKAFVLNFTGKREYQFGDVAKELANRVASSEVNMQDVILLLKILVALGATIGPLAEILPFAFLIEALNLSMEQKVGGKILEVLSKALDNRIVAALFTSDDKHLIGDVVKRTALSGVLSFTGKSDYQEGDIQRTVQQGQEEDWTDDMKLELDTIAASQEFEEWDRLFVETLESDEEHMGAQAKIMDMQIAQALEECESIAQKKSDESR
jgi:hypothetical protein